MIYNKIFYLMDSSLFTSLIQYDSMKLDLELKGEYPGLNLIPQKTIQKDYHYQEQSMSTQPLDSLNSQLSFSDNHSSFGNKALSMIKVSEAKKTKKIKKYYSAQSSTQQSDISSSEGKIRPRKNKDMKNSQYPTKNFLPNFKGPHLQFLQKYLGKNINSHEFIQQLKKKDGISLKDYEKLYTTKEFYEAFKSMFACKFLYRELLLSRSDPYTKKIHQRKVHVFEEAFKAQSFTRIN